MLHGVRCAALLAAVFSAQAAPALTSRDAAVIPLFRAANPSISHYGILWRSEVRRGQEMIVALGSPSAFSADDDPYRGPFGLGQNIWLGVFLQSRGNPAVTRQVSMIAAGGSEDGFGVVRVSAEEAVFLRTPVERLPVIMKLFFDTRSGKLIKQITYNSFYVSLIRVHEGAPYFIACDLRRIVAIRPDAAVAKFELMRGAEAKRILTGVPLRLDPWAPGPFPTLRFGPNLRYAVIDKAEAGWANRRAIVERTKWGARNVPLPAVPPAEYARLRPDMVKGGLPEPDGIRGDVGPAQLVEGRLWFGKAFTDAVDDTGVGGFGNFDPVTAKFQIFSPPEVRAWSVSAMLVERDAVWLALIADGEYGLSGGGVLRWDRRGHTVTKYPLEPFSWAMARYKGTLALATRDGIAVIDSGGIREYFVDVDLRGGLRVVEKSRHGAAPSATLE